MFSNNKYLGLLANIHSTPTHWILNTNYHQTQGDGGGRGGDSCPRKNISKCKKFIINQNHQTYFSLNSFFSKYSKYSNYLNIPVKDLQVTKLSFEAD